jgi:hypothetical protein
MARRIVVGERAVTSDEQLRTDHKYLIQDSRERLEARGRFKIRDSSERLVAKDRFAISDSRFKKRGCNHAYQSPRAH